MGTTAFGAPVQDAVADDQQNGQQAGGGAGTDAQVQELDPNDPRLTSESLDDNAEGNAYASLPPLPDGKWRAKLKQVDVKGADGKPVRSAAKLAQWLNPPVPYLYTALEASVISLGGKEKYDGYRINDNWVPTIPNRSGTSPAATIIRKAGGQTPAKFTHAQLMELLLKTLAGEPEVVIETAWEAACQHCQEEAAKSGARKPKNIAQGEHRFPQGKVAGTHDPNVQCPTCKGWVLARPRIVGYYSVAEAKV
jgi:hypothetical protein